MPRGTKLFQHGLATLPKPEDRWYVTNFGKRKSNGKLDVRFVLHRPSVSLICEPLWGRFNSSRGMVIIPPRKECVRLFRRALGVIHRHRFDSYLTVKDLFSMASHRRQITEKNVAAIDVTFFLMVREALPHLSVSDVQSYADCMPPGTRVRKKLQRLASSLRRQGHTPRAHTDLLAALPEAAE